MGPYIASIVTNGRRTELGAPINQTAIFDDQNPKITHSVLQGSAAETDLEKLTTD